MTATEAMKRLNMTKSTFLPESADREEVMRMRWAVLGFVVTLTVLCMAEEAITDGE